MQPDPSNSPSTTSTNQLLTCCQASSNLEPLGPETSSEHPSTLETASKHPDIDILSQEHNSSFFSRLLAHLHTRFVEQCNPADFASVMGTGITANILYNFPFPRGWLQIIGTVVGLLSTCIFAALLATHVAGVIRNPCLLSRMHRDPTYAPFMGAFVMGYTSLVMFLHAVLGSHHIIAQWVLFWLVTVGSVYTALVTLFYSTIAKSHKSENFLESSNITMAFLLPVVTLTVAASCGQMVAADLSPRMQGPTMAVAFIMWSVAMCLAFIIVTINFWRLFVYKSPHSGQVLMMFLPIGYAGQGAFGLLLFGRNCAAHATSSSASASWSPLAALLPSDPAYSTSALLAAVLVMCVFVAAMLISFGYFLTALAVLSVLSKIRPFSRKPNGRFIYTTSSSSRWKRPFVGLLRFHRGFWAMTFPLGTMSLANTEMYRMGGGLAFRYIGALYAGALFALVLGCLVGAAYRFVGMVYAARRREPSPC